MGESHRIHPLTVPLFYPFPPQTRNRNECIGRLKSTAFGKSRIVFIINQHQLIHPNFVSFGQAFNTELYRSETLKHGSRFFLMAIKNSWEGFSHQTRHWPQITSPHSLLTLDLRNKKGSNKIFGLRTKSKQRVNHLEEKIQRTLLLVMCRTFLIN